MMRRIKDYVDVRTRFLPHRPEAGPEREAYDALVDGLLEYRGSIRMPRMVTMDDLGRIVGLAKLDVPELFYVGSGTANLTSLGPCALNLTYCPRYRLDEKDVLSVLEAMGRATDEVVEERMRARHPAPLGTTAHRDRRLEDLVALHDWLVGHFAYADGERSYAHEASGPLVYGVGVCDGVARAYKYLCDRCGLACCVVSGEARDSSRPSDGFGPHAWNLVAAPARTERSSRDQPRPGGASEWTNVDVTFDATISHAVVRHDYFGVTDAEIAASHRRDASDALPDGDGALCYYESRSLVAASATHLSKIVDHDLPRQGGAEFAMPRIWESRAQADGAIERGISQSSALGRAGRGYAIYPNYDRMVFCVEALS